MARLPPLGLYQGVATPSTRVPPEIPYDSRGMRYRFGQILLL